MAKYEPEIVDGDVNEQRGLYGGKKRKHKIDTNYYCDGEKVNAVNFPTVYNKARNIKQACINPNNTSYHLYGDLGYTVCKEWCGMYGTRKFAAWLLANGYLYGSDIVLIGENNDKEYSPGNCAIAFKAGKLSYVYKWKHDWLLFKKIKVV